MPVPGQPKVGTRLPLPPAKSRFRSTSATPSLFMCDNEGRFETHKETIIGHLGPEYFDVVQNRLLDFDTTRSGCSRSP
jgi:hypothetical protein